MTNTSQPSNEPPRVARWLLGLFVPSDQVSPILGDLLEEFSGVASRRGIGAARHWYWRQSAKTIPHLLDVQLRSAPWRNLATVASGVLLLWLAKMPLLLWQAAVGSRAYSHYYQADWPELPRLALIAVVPWLPLIDLVIGSILIGWIVARVSRGREMAVTITIGFAMAMLRVIALATNYGPITEPPPVWSLFWLADPFAVVVCPLAVFTGGLVARKRTPALA